MKNNTRNTAKLNKRSRVLSKKNRTFNKNDYMSGDGMLTSVWGPGMWHYLHTMSFNYPVLPTEDDKKHYRDFIFSLQYVLPCKYCRMNLKANFKQMPITMECMKNRESFSRYVYNLHEIVNKMLKKTSNLSYDDVRERYEHFRARCTQEKPRVFKFLKKSVSKTRKNNKTNGNGKEKEKGCTEPLYGKKSKCIIKIVPQEDKTATFQMDKKCVKERRT